VWSSLGWPAPLTRRSDVNGQRLPTFYFEDGPGRLRSKCSPATERYTPVTAYQQFSHYLQSASDENLAPSFSSGAFFRGPTIRLVLRFWAKLSSAGVIVTEHKFKIGGRVLFHPKAKGLQHLDSARGIYHIIRRMPPTEDGEFQYEIRSEREGHNRVAKESELTPA
jgi:hypothetical protein